jgi:hypothetical protein
LEAVVALVMVPVVVVAALVAQVAPVVLVGLVAPVALVVLVELVAPVALVVLVELVAPVALVVLVGLVALVVLGDADVLPLDLRLVLLPSLLVLQLFELPLWLVPLARPFSRLPYLPNWLLALQHALFFG